MRILTRMTLAAALAAALPAIAAAQSGGSMQADSTGRHDTGMHRGMKQGMHGMMGGSMGLSSDQVMQLQQGLTAAGCDAGTADGKIGPRTHRAMQCAAQKNNVSSGNVNELFRAMNLSFTASDSMPMSHGSTRGGMKARGMKNGDMNHGGMRDSSSMSGHTGTMGSGADSTRSKVPR
jgi:peptidoglycan hydrolase-like protein with peptidoglycan-binding domain